MNVFTDHRDGNTYNTVEINGQVWLAENLKFEGVEHYAPNGNENNIPKYGCLYKWEDALKACLKDGIYPARKNLKLF